MESSFKMIYWLHKLGLKPVWEGMLTLAGFHNIESTHIKNYGT